MLLSNSVKSNGVSTVSKKSFSIDLDYFLVAFLFLIVLFGSKGFAFELNAPNEVVVNDNTVFYVDLVNDSSSTVDLKLDFHSPVDVLIVAPKKISPNSTIQAKITITNNFRDERIIMGLVEASFDEKVLTKEVELHFKRNNSSSSDLTGLFSIGSTINGFELFTLIDWVIFIILVIVCAILLVSFIAKLKRRV